MPGGYQIDREICNGTDQGTNTATSSAVSITSSATAGVYGSYAQIVASSAIDACFVHITITGGNFSNSNNLMVKLAVGAAASEVDLIKDMVFFNGSTVATSISYTFPVDITAGTRISAAIAPSVSGADAAVVQVTLFDGAFSQIEGSPGVDSIGFSSTHGTTVTAGAANTKGSYAQLVASTSKDYLGFCFSLDGNGSASIPISTALIDIAIGGSGSEQVILPNYLIVNGQSALPSPSTVSDLFTIPIPSGTRVAARFQNSAGSGNLGITLYGVYQ